MDAVLYSHDHADQVHGIDDLRAFAITNRRRTPCYMDGPTRKTLLERFGYIFKDYGGYPAICDAIDLPPHGADWAVDGPSGAIPVVGFDMNHGGVRAVGFRFGPVAYCSDVVELPPASLEALAGIDVFIIDALRYRPHPTHATVAQALAWSEALQPRRTILTNMHIDLDFAALAAKLPNGVEPAVDGLSFTVPI